MTQRKVVRAMMLVCASLDPTSDDTRGEAAEVRPERAQADAGAQAPVGVLRPGSAR